MHIPRRTHRRRLWTALIIPFAALASIAAQAAVVLDNTRVVFDASKRESSMIVNNPTRRAYAIQTWVNDATDDDTRLAPFIATPPLFRLDSRKAQTVRIISTATDALPKDRESLFYFNVQEIPTANDTPENVLKVALRTRVKLLYRPPGLGNANDSGERLRWTLERQDGKHALRVHNPSPFHVSFIGIKAIAFDHSEEVAAPLMVEPFSNRLYTLDSAAVRPLSVVFSIINDYGGYSTPIQFQLPVDSDGSPRSLPVSAGTHGQP